MCSCGTLGVERGKVSHCFIFGSETFAEGIRHLFGNLTEVVYVIMAFVDAGHADASGGVDKCMISMGG